MGPMKVCCGYWTLQKGCIIIGVITCIIHVIGLTAIPSQFLEIGNDFDPESDFDPKEDYWSSTSDLAANVCFMILVVMVSIVFNIGIIKKEANYVFPFVCIAFSGVVIYFGIYVGYIIRTCATFTGDETTKVILLLIPAILYCLLIYVTLLVYSFYKELVAKEYKKSADICNNNYQPPFVQEVYKDVSNGGSFPRGC